ncbi:hypothetical protein MNEG_4198 [Monoraphidium neglectum]|uniref:MARVEL domain-containing protein n=1 Tax=Monoraphidium neglectum TaxID=145388 RepID=A0A0D2JZ26_9CHLO|nr:hypothetical protein MNEG_4198 [Monoraphidium neglectum]KIZ03763.1 hypothetical protein MNEG_4198 [Monoraphidium neglectum]|eukprot:XP_013902782.1 hypothetical protein MNEG_4198 [Monoraphidium neglectum]
MRASPSSTSQLAVATALLFLVANHLDVTEPAHYGSPQRPTAVCLLGTTTRGADACRLAYIFGGVSILATLGLGLLLVLTCNLCGVGAVLDAMFALAGAAWWATAGMVFTGVSRRPDVQKLPFPARRDWAVLLCWLGFALFAAAFVTNLVRVYLKCCGEERGSGLPTKQQPVQGVPVAHTASALVAANQALYGPYVRPPPVAGYPTVSGPAAAAYAYPGMTAYTAQPNNCSQAAAGQKAAQPIVHSVRQQQVPTRLFVANDVFGPNMYWGVAAARH